MKDQTLKTTYHCRLCRVEMRGIGRICSRCVDTFGNNLFAPLLTVHLRADGTGIPPKTVRVSSLIDASETVKKWIEKWGLMSSETGLFRIANGDKFIGYVSYNGRVWPA